MMAVTAKRWFRILFSCAIEALHSGTRPACKAIQFIAGGIVPQKKFSSSALFPMNFWSEAEPVEPKSVSCRGTR
jgi:hypothetical protein